MRRDGVWITLLAAVLGISAAVVMMVTASEARTAVAPLMTIAVALHITFLLLGSARWVASASLPMVGAIVLESGFADDPSWIRSIALGCWWYVTMEVSWDAIERRHGARHTAAATARRVQEVATVVGVALAIGAGALALQSLAPARSVALQAVVLGGLLTALIAMIRQVTAS